MKGFLKGCLKFIAVIAIIYGAYRVYEWIRYAPSRNPHPKYTMTVEGKIDPALQSDIRLKWITTYYTTNPACRVSINWLEGVSRYRTHVDSIRVKPGDTGNYRYEIPLDKYLPGMCGWRVSNIEYDASLNGISQLKWPIFFSDEAKGQEAHSIIRMICKKAEHDCEYGRLDNFHGKDSLDSDISRNQNHIYTLNIMGEKE